jgi:DNA segregation ATPase FtsK/SpoIIIE, S-DNA-T family
MAKKNFHGRPWWQRFLLFMLTRVLVLLAVAAIIFWKWGTISSWISDKTADFIQLFGFGIVLVAIALLLIVEVALTKPGLFLRLWNKWIGGIFELVAIWGILGFIAGPGRLQDHSLGGEIGRSIIGHSTPVGVLIVLALIIAGCFFIVPKGFARILAGVFSFPFRRRSREPAVMSSTALAPHANLPPRMTIQGKEVEQELKSTVFPKYKPPVAPRPNYPVHGSKNWLWNRLHPQNEDAVSGIPPAPASDLRVPLAGQPVVGVTDTIQATAPGGTEENTRGDIDTAKAETKKEEKTPGAKSGKDLKQVAQEVWRKYGEAGAQVTLDGWKLPPLEILDNAPEVEFSQADNLKKAKLIEDALASYGVEGKVVQINVGPTVTQFGIEPGWDRKMKEIKEKDKNGDVQVKIEEVAKTRVKVDRITSLSNDLSLALAAPSIRIEAPVPGKSVVGVEVPNTNIGVVSLRGVVESNIFQKMQAKAKLSLALGKGAGGESVVGDLTKMPHLLIAGATGSGKTVCIHSIVCCLLLHNTPGDVRFIMIDPKRVELTSYNSLPHLATPVIVETNRALLSLRWLTQEMDKRYQTMAAARARNIEMYNKSRPQDKLPYLVLVIDELADLMMTAGDEVEHTLCRLAQLARAVGIHLIVATQRPSVDVVTGLIKANFPTRISFAVTSQVDSRTILDTGGAEKLLGRGDMLYMPTEAAKPKRLQGCYVSDPETERLVYFWNNQKKETASQLKMDDIVAAEESKIEKAPEDPLMVEVHKLAEQHEHISASFLQRHLRIGYPRAARLMEEFQEEMGEEDEGEDAPEKEEHRPL